MNNKSVVDQVDKVMWTLLESVKDTLMTNIVAMVRAKEVVIEHAHLEKVLAVASASVDEAYAKGHRVLLKSIEELDKPVVVQLTKESGGRKKSG